MTKTKAGTLYLTIIIFHVIVVFTVGSVGLLVPSVYDMLPGTLISEGIIVVPSLIFALCTPASFSEMFLWKKVSIRNLLYGILLLALAFPLTTFLNLVSMQWVDNTFMEMSGDILVHPMWQMILLIGVFGPICEELVFRGYIYTGLRSTGRVAGAIIVSSLLFGLMHLNLNQALYAAALGVFLAIAVEATGSIFTSIVMHMAFNTFEVVLLYQDQWIAEANTDLQAIQASGEMAGGLSLPVTMAVYGGLSLLGILLAILVIKRMTKISGRSLRAKPLAPQEKRPQVWSVPLIFGIILSCIYIVFTELFLM